MKKISFKEYQDLLVEKFIKINEEFEKKGIFWWAHSGTLLGIIRDHGMIEWDDDIDMAMSYKDFEENYHDIKKIVEENNFDIFDPVRNTGEDTVKIIGKEYFLVEWDGRLYEWRLSIDVMLSLPLELKDKQQHTQHTLFSLNYLFRRHLIFLPPNYIKNGKRKRVPKIFNFFVYIFKPIFLPVVPIIKRKFKKSISKEYSWDKQFMYYIYPNKNWSYNINEFTKVEFFSTRVNISTRYKDELELWFGNYNQIPPKEKRIPHHMLVFANEKTN